MKCAVIGFISAENPRELGVVTKMRSIVRAFSNLGLTADLVTLSNGKLVVNRTVVRKGLGKVGKYLSLIEFLDSQNYEILYLRGALVNNGLLSFLIRNWRRAKKTGRIVCIEVPTNSTIFLQELLRVSDMTVVRKCRFILQYFLFQPLLYSVADVIVIISENGYLERLFRKKSVIVSNGISCDLIPLAHVSIPHLDEIHLLGVGNLSFWHGYDRIIKGIALSRVINDKKVFFHIVGDGEAANNLKNLTRQLGLQDQVIFEGPRTGEQLTEIFEKCHIAVGSIGIHRNGIRVAAPLKHREYCARGIPFIFSGGDPDFPHDFPFALRIPDNDEPVDVRAVFNWYANIVQNYPDYPVRMRRYAEESLSWEAKLKPVVERIEQILGKRQ